MRKFLLFLVLFPVLTLAVFISYPPSKSHAPLPPGASHREPSGTRTIRIAAVGDIMMHSPQIKAGATGNGFDFRSFFREVKPYLESADVTFGNLETTLAGNRLPWSGYPRFNSPDQLVDALKDSGFDVLSTANNHSMDTGEAGVIRTWQTVKDKGLHPAGSAPTPDDRGPVLIKTEDITLAFLAYTQHTNGLPVPKDKPWLVNRISPEQVARDISEARKAGADFVLVSLHFGTEYRREPDEYQIKTATQILEAGADVILGSHPHVLQPIRRKNVDGKEKWVIYSMGNFISNQTDRYTDEGIIVYLDIEKNLADGSTRLKKISWLPTFVHRYDRGGKWGYAVIPMESKTPANLPDYPGLTRQRWTTAWTHTETLIRKEEDLPVFKLSETDE
ncbi:CapA family protein [Staphylospora marina]|uniref:CapA family protein n=1 Tax=Staphylospora marina TaxID=2490858 RepID=UPI000F5B88F9|nr:CapA family protein [Staphylospora marina]